MADHRCVGRTTVGAEDRACTHRLRACCQVPHGLGGPEGRAVPLLHAPHARRYLDGRLLAGTGLFTPPVAPYAKPVFHLYVVQVPDRAKQQAAFDAANISHGIHYPIPVHLQPAFAELDYPPGSFPVTEALVGKIISLPMFPELTDAQIERVAGACLKASARAAYGSGARTTRNPIKSYCLDGASEKRQADRL